MQSKRTGPLFQIDLNHKKSAVALPFIMLLNICIKIGMKTSVTLPFFWSDFHEIFTEMSILEIRNDINHFRKFLLIFFQWERA